MSDIQVDTPLLEDMSLEKAEPTGVGGWLMFFITFGLFLGAVRNLAECTTIITAFFGLPLVGLGLWAAFQLLRGRKQGVLIAKIYLGYYLFIGVLSAFGDSAPHLHLIRAAVFTSLWFTYLMTSRRVKNTYYNDALVAHS